MVQANTTLINKILTITNASKSMVHCYTPGVNLLVEIPARKFENNINLTSSSAYSQLTALHLTLQSYFPINEVMAEPHMNINKSKTAPAALTTSANNNKEVSLLNPPNEAIYLADKLLKEEQALSVPPIGGLCVLRNEGRRLIGDISNV